MGCTDGGRRRCGSLQTLHRYLHGRPGSSAVHGSITPDNVMVRGQPCAPPPIQNAHVRLPRLHPLTQGPAFPGLCFWAPPLVEQVAVLPSGEPVFKLELMDGPAPLGTPDGDMRDTARMLTSAVSAVAPPAVVPTPAKPPAALYVAMRVGSSSACLPLV